ncbi:MAG: hypothetical protein AAGJ31_10730 [Verrucomicrobiota bacterium]
MIALLGCSFESKRGREGGSAGAHEPEWKDESLAEEESHSVDVGWAKAEQQLELPLESD